MKKYIIILCVFSLTFYDINIQSPEGGLRRKKFLISEFLMSVGYLR